jgi:hypothetical protein
MLTWKTKKEMDEIKMGHRTVVRMRGGWERLTVMSKKLFLIINFEPSDSSAICSWLLVSVGHTVLILCN